MRYRAKAYPLYEGHKQIEKAFPVYTDARSVNQAGRFFGMRYPYPKYLVEDIMPDPKGRIVLRIVKVAGTDEYKVRWIKDGVFSEAKSYYTDDYVDAINTANAMAAEAQKAGYTVEQMHCPAPKGAERQERRDQMIANPGQFGAHREMRVKLIGLKTDIERVAPELEPLYRVALEDAVKLAEDCLLFESIEKYSYALDVGKLIERRFTTPSTELPFLKLLDIEDFAKTAIYEALVENCKCELRKPE